MPASPSRPATKSIIQIIHKSPIPDPKRSEYEDCLYAAEAKVLKIREGRQISPEIILVLPAFKKRVLQPEAAFAEGQVIEVESISDEGASDKQRTMQRSDTLDRFDLPVHHSLSTRPSTETAESITAQSEVKKAGDPKVSTEEPAPATMPVRYPWSERAATERQAAIQAAKEVILSAFKENGGDWEVWNNKLRPFLDDLADQKRATPEHELFKGPFEYNNMYHGNYQKVCATAEKGEPGPMLMLASLNTQLRARGIDLIVVPFPTKEDVHAEVFSNLAPKDGWFEPYRQKFLLQLLEADIEVIDLIQPLRAARSRFPYVFYDDDDEHPADGGIQVAAEEIAKRLARYELTGQRVKLQLERAEVKKPVNKVLKTYPATRVVREDGKELEVPENSGAPVIIMGDSYTRIPHHYLDGGDGCALPMHIAHQLGMLPDHLVRMGGSDQAMRLLARQGGNYLANRRALVFVFAHNRLFGTVARNVDYKEDGWDMITFPPIILDK